MVYSVGVFLLDDPDQDQWYEITQIKVHQMNWWILSKGGVISSFDALWSEWSQITDPGLLIPMWIILIDLFHNGGLLNNIFFYMYDN